MPKHDAHQRTNMRGFTNGKHPLRLTERFFSAALLREDFRRSLGCRLAPDPARCELREGVLFPFIECLRELICLTVNIIVPLIFLVKRFIEKTVSEKYLFLRFKIRYNGKV